MRVSAGNRPITAIGTWGGQALAIVVVLAVGGTSAAMRSEGRSAHPSRVGKPATTLTATDALALAYGSADVAGLDVTATEAAAIRRRQHGGAVTATHPAANPAAVSTTVAPRHAAHQHAAHARRLAGHQRERPAATATAEARALRRAARHAGHTHQH